MAERTVSMIFVRSTLLALGAANVDAIALATRLGIPGETLGDVDASVPVALYYRLWHEGADLTGDPSFGLRAGQRIPIGAYDVLDYILRSSRDLGDAITKTMRYFSVMNRAADLELRVDGDRASLRHRLVSDGLVPPRHMSECFLSLLVARWRAAVVTSGAGAVWPLQVISFMHPRPDDVSEHRRVFAAELCFERDYNAIDFDRALLDAPFAAADAGLNELLGRTAERMVGPRAVAAAPAPDPRHAFRDLVRAAAMQAASAGDFSVDAIARQLKLSKRTLQRKLREDQVSADALIDDIRRELAMRCLEQRGIAIAEVAALVGFSDLSAFYRAFKRWTGTTPRRYLDAR